MIQSKRKRIIPQSQTSNTLNTDEDVIISQISIFERYKTEISSSPLFECITDTITLHITTNIQCLAIGLPFTSTPALYQLALLDLIAERLGVTKDKILIWDPILSLDHNDEFDAVEPKEVVLNQMGLEKLGFTISEPTTTDQHSDQDININHDTFYFLPHAPMDLTEIILRNNHPKMLLGNNVLVHALRLPSENFKIKCPSMNQVVKVAQPSLNSTIPTGEFKFQTVTKKKKRRNRKKNNIANVDEHNEDVNFVKSCIITELPDETNNIDFARAFSDLAFHLIDYI